jgi:hypothetical protein
MSKEAMKEASRKPAFVFPSFAAIANLVRVFSAKAPPKTRMCQCSARGTMFCCF